MFTVRRVFFRNVHAVELELLDPVAFRLEAIKSRRKAIDLSVRKWEFVLNYLTQNTDGYPMSKPMDDTCALCMKYIDNRCSKCPVAKETELLFCDGSPYDPIPQLLKPNNQRHIACVKREIEFLKSLK